MYFYYGMELQSNTVSSPGCPKMSDYYNISYCTCRSISILLIVNNSA